jgi:hypothetical protein
MKGLLRLKSSLLGLRVESTAATQYHECLSETHTTTIFIKPKVACGPPNRAPRATGEPPLRKVGCSEYELLPLALPSALHGRYHLSPQRSLDPFFVRRCGVGFGRVALTSASRVRVPRALRCCGGIVWRGSASGPRLPSSSRVGKLQRVERGNPDSGGELWNRI